MLFKLDFSGEPVIANENFFVSTQYIAGAIPHGSKLEQNLLVSSCFVDFRSWSHMKLYITTENLSDTKTCHVIIVSPHSK